jgi:hypothetical protein
MWIIYTLKYFLIGFVFNLIYDTIIYYVNREDLRFNVLERFVFACIWPVYAIMLIHTLIKTIIYGPDDDE